ncbi:His-Xaa-Ser system radical SAM maturase HxsC [Nitrincola sp.]|uniref:His-Xaa-Ser system radical SAM maturase HxsC n=1 Tax=Nitrincola sp. TaxID=1926584 RepID=UPI003A953453
MSDTSRIDLFEINERSDFEHGYYVLRKSDRPVVSELPQLRVYSDISEQNDDGIVDQELFQTIDDLDVGMVTGRGHIRVMMSRRANHNSVLLTERCDNRCLFCSQPPKDRDDEWLLEVAGQSLCDFKYEGVIGISGGEPLLYRDKLIVMLKKVTQASPSTSFHILTNGRALSDLAFCRDLAEAGKEINFVLGVPLYGAYPSLHDELVGAKGAFFETVKGLINAGNLGIPIELRFIPNQLNYHNIREVFELVTRTFSSIQQISVMNLEPTGWAKHNWSALYIRPEQYSVDLLKSIEYVSGLDIKPVLFNYPLCHLSLELKQHAVKSISDWKNFYPIECDGCQLQSECGGYFVSSNGDRFDPPRRNDESN